MKITGIKSEDFEQIAKEAREKYEKDEKHLEKDR